MNAISFKWTRPLIQGHGSRDNNFDFMRFFLAIAVIYCHCYVIHYGTEDGVEPLWVASNRQISIGSVAVNFFFVISGYLIFQSWQKAASFGDYMYKRILRIYPGFIIAGLLCLFIFAPLGTSDYYQPLGYWSTFFSEVDFAVVLRHILTLQQLELPDTFEYVPLDHVINGSLWTIRYEFLCYLLIPLLQICGIYRHKYLLLATLILSMAVLYLQDHHQIMLYNWQTAPFIGKPDYFPRFLTYFLAGMCVYQYRDSIPRSRWIFIVSLLCIYVGFFVVKGVNLVLPIFGTYVLFYLAFTSSSRLKDFGKHGDFSYGLYVYAWPIQQLIVLHLDKNLNIGLFFVLSTLLTFPLAWLSWKYVEMPFLSLKSKVISGWIIFKEELIEQSPESAGHTETIDLKDEMGVNVS